MEPKDVDLASLKIDRSSMGPGRGRKARRARRVFSWLVVTVILGGISLYLAPFLSPGIQVQLVTASLTSPAQANSVLTASGYVVARRKAAVASKGTGQLVYLAVEEGDTVKKGQLIARLEAADVLATLERARMNLRMQEADLNDAKQSLDRQKTLLNKQFIAQADFDAAEARYKRVVASIDAARAGVKEAEAAVDNTRIVAPFDGTVVNKNADIGEIVAPLAGAASSRAAVVTIADLTSLEVEADVSEANIPLVFSGQPCEINLDAYPEHRYPAYVSKIIPTADRAKATVQVKIRFKSYDRRVLPDMSARITFLPAGSGDSAAMTKPVLSVPATAVAQRSGRQVVYQVEDGRAVEVEVVLGQRMGGLIEIKSGLKAGDKVIARVDDKLQSGAKIALTTK